MSGWRLRGVGTIATAATAVALTACGGGAPQDAHEPSGNFPVKVSTATFPSSQRLAEHTNLVIAVQNAGQKTIPDVAVTILDPNEGTSAQAFGQNIGGTSSDLASRSRPVWIVDRPPGPCKYSCQQGGPGGAVTAYSNTWALGALKPGQTATFEWGVTAVKSGVHTIQYQIAAGLNGKAKAVDSSGKQPTGTFKVTVHQTPQQSYVNNQGQVVTSQ